MNINEAVIKIKSSSLYKKFARLAHQLAGKEFIRFLITGFSVTVTTYLIYLTLLLFLKYTIAYTITYAIGIVISYIVNSLFVFRVRLNLKKFLQFPFVYVAHYTLGILVIYLAVEQLQMPESIAPLIVLAISIPITFLLSRYLLKTSHQQ